jgi:3-oxoacyl-[acyl-carrier protein] reductase
MSQGELDGRRALVTGAARNIGRAIALELARAGAVVTVGARTARAEAESVVLEIRAGGGQAHLYLADVATPKGAADLVRAAVEAWGGLDILVNNAAVRREVDFANLGWDEWREVLGVALDGAYLCAHAAWQHLVAAGQDGVVINIGGLSAHVGAAGRAHVLAAKAGLVGLTRGLAHDLASSGGRANCVAPGLIDTVRTSPSTTGGTPAHHARHASLTGGRGVPADVAAMVRFLCGPEARYITGQTIHVNGGAYLG